MADMVYKIALAGLLHDVGKFAERAGMEVSKQYMNDNAGLYQKYNREQNRHSHVHALYTAAFIEKFTGALPMMDDVSSAKSGDSLINMAAMHHKPETPLQAIVTEADRLSSGLDRQVFEGDEQGVAIKHFRRTRLIPIAEQMLKGKEFYKGDNLDSYRFRYPLLAMSPARIFPQLQEEVEDANDEKAKAEYAALFDKFVNALPSLEQRDQPSLWLEHFDSLYQTFSASIPAATVGKVIPDVSLYDHSRATAALSAALYRYHAATGTLKESLIHNRDDKKFLIISGDFYGIQKFIFSDGGSTNKAAAKLLRGRSFAVSLLSEMAADMLSRELNLPVTSLLLNAAGKFTLLAANLPDAKQTVLAVEEKINRWLIERYFGEVTIGFSTVEASGNDFDMKAGHFANLWSELGRAGDARKYRKYDLALHGGVVCGYLDSFDNRYGLCPYCGKRPAVAATANDPLFKGGDAACLTCRDHLYLGDKLVKSKRLVLTRADTLSSGKLKEPLFGEYQIAFDPTVDFLAEMHKRGLLLRLWHTGKVPDDIPTGVAVRFISGYVPTYRKEDEYDNRLLHGSKSEQTKLELIDMINEGSAKSFHHIAKAALNPRPDSEEKFAGTEALGFLKADVDNLGKIFACGLPENRLNLSRLATFSRQLNSFFALYLPNLLATDVRFQNIYTVFAGGDDLFLIGPWNRIIEFSSELQKQFARFACGNPEITISAGITVDKPGVPVPTTAAQAEQALEAAKHGGRNRLTLFGETVTWDEFRSLLKNRDRLEEWQSSGVMGKAFIYQLNELIVMAKKEKKLLKSEKAIDLRDMTCLGWRSRLTYTASRNVGKGMDKAARMTALDEILQELPLWLLKYDGKMKIALWQVLYNQR